MTRIRSGPHTIEVKFTSAQRLLAIAGMLLALAASALLAWRVWIYAPFEKVHKTASGTTTTHGHPGPPMAVVTALFAAAAVLILAAAFFERVQKITAFGVEIDLSATIPKLVEKAIAKAQEAKKPEKAAELARSAASKLLEPRWEAVDHFLSMDDSGYLRMETLTGPRVAPRDAAARSMTLDDADIDAAVTEAASEMRL